MCDENPFAKVNATEERRWVAGLKEDPREIDRQAASAAFPKEVSIEVFCDRKMMSFAFRRFEFQLYTHRMLKVRNCLDVGHCACEDRCGQRASLQTFWPFD